MICQYSIFCASLRRPWEISSLQSPLSLAAAIEQTKTKTKPNKTKTKQDRDERRKETKGQRKNAEYAQIEFDF